MKKMVTGVLALVMVLVMVGCGQKDNGVVNGVAKDGATIGEGAKSFTTEVVDKDGGKVTFTVKTDADTVGKALLDQGVIAGEDSSYGLYVKTVNGITLDYDTDGMYWAFYINGEYAQTGVEVTSGRDTGQCGKTNSPAALLWECFGGFFNLGKRPAADTSAAGLLGGCGGQRALVYISSTEPKEGRFLPLAVKPRDR